MFLRRSNEVFARDKSEARRASPGRIHGTAI